MSTYPRFPGVRPAHVPADRVMELDIYDLPGVANGFHEAWQAQQARAPADLVWTPCNGGHWVAMRGAMIHEMFADHERFSSSNNLVPKPGGRGLPPLNLDPPQHRDYRLLLNDSLSLKEIRKSEPRLRELAAELIDPMIGRGRCNFTHDYAETYPIRIFAALMGLPMADTPRLKWLTDRLTRPAVEVNRRSVIHELLEYMRPKVEARRADPTDDLMSHLALAQVDGALLPLDDAADLCVQMMLAGLDTVINFLGFAMHFLATHADERQRLAMAPSEIPNAVGELFRRYPVVVTGRCVAKDLHYDGVAMREGEMVILPTVLHGLDPREHESPLSYDAQRRRRSHSTFGNGPHRCPGSHLALLEVRVTIEAWLARIPDFEVAEPVEFEGGVTGALRSLVLRWD